MDAISDAILQRLDAIQPGARTPRIVAIDGRCAAGKTTLAESLGRALGCRVFHMDDFFLRPEQRTPERLQTPGGNVDYERFLAEVLLPLTRGAALTYRPYDCQTQRLCAPVAVRIGQTAVVEGTYACHPALAAHYALRVFLTLDPEEQLRRIKQRNGPAGLARFRSTWIPLEELYFVGCGTAQRCDLRFDTTRGIREQNEVKS